MFKSYNQTTSYPLQQRRNWNAELISNYFCEIGNQCLNHTIKQPAIHLLNSTLLLDKDITGIYSI